MTQTVTPAVRRLWLGGIKRSRHQLVLRYGIDDLHFETTLWYEDCDLLTLEAVHGTDFMDRLGFHLLVLEASKLVSLRPDVFDLGDQARWYTLAFEQMWRRVVRHVWGQWRYRQDDPHYFGPEVLTAPLDQVPAPVHVTPGPVEVLAFCGGGKDSLVGARLLERAGVPFATFGYSNSIYGRAEPQHALIDRLVDRLSERGADTRHHRLRVFDSVVEAPLQQVYPEIHEVLAAETPCSLFAALPVLLQHGYRAMVLAHERSANTGNLVWSRTGEDINHQWGKSYDAERLLNDYLRTELVANVSYYSVLQPVYDTTIFNLLRQDEHLVGAGATHSCNIAKPWCGRCAKCAYVWLNYMAYLDPAEVRRAIPGNLFDVEENQPWFFQMLGLGEHTPFECIGQVEEARLAFALCHRKGLTGRAMDLYRQHFPVLDTAPILDRFLSVDMAQSAIPEPLATRLRPLLEAGAAQGRTYIDHWLGTPA
jgi:UDP-N-acetyl-alpha-D-muramoyl-L-alanyl-L-glutamate epimerase